MLRLVADDLIADDASVELGQANTAPPDHAENSGGGGPAPLRLDRRGYPRKVLSQTLTAIYTAADGQRGVLRVAVVDGSWLGLGVVSDRPLDLGTEVSFCAPGVPLVTRIGTVVRQEQAGTAHRLGIRLDPRRADASPHRRPEFKLAN